VVILYVFKKGINDVSCFPVFLSYVLGVFNSPVAIQHTGSSGFARVFDNDLYRRTRACLLGIFLLPPTAQLHYLVNSGSFLWDVRIF